MVKVLNDFAGTLRPPRYARDGPSRLTDRAAMTLPSSSRSAPDASRISSTCDGHPVAEFAGAEPAFDDSAVGARPNAGGVGARTAEQVQAR